MCANLLFFFVDYFLNVMCYNKKKHEEINIINDEVRVSV